MHEELIRELATIDEGDVPVLSVYLDLRPHASGKNAMLRTGEVVLKDRLREIEKTLGPRGPLLDSFRADAAAVEQFMTQELGKEIYGLAVFSCAASGLFEAVTVGTSFTDQVSYEPLPDLYQLARLQDNYETAVVAVVDTNTARLFVRRSGAFEETGGPDDKNAKMYRKRSMGGLNQKRFQTRIENNREAFAQVAAAEIERLVLEEDASRLILAGDEVAIPLLRNALSPQMQERMHGEALRIHIRAPQQEIAEEVAPLLALIEAEEDQAIADRLLAEVRGDHLGVAGLAATQRALEFGQADTLILAAEASLPEETRSELVRLAAASSAVVEVIANHDGLQDLGGVGALLRYRHD